MIPDSRGEFGCVVRQHTDGTFILPFQALQGDGGREGGTEREGERWRERRERGRRTGEEGREREMT